MRARELCERLGDSQELFSALYGLWSKHSVRGELEVAYGLAEQLLRQAERTHDPALLLYGRVALGNTSYFMGKFLLAREHLEMAVSMYDPENHGQLALLYGFDAGVNCLSYAAWILWQLGHPDQALQRGNEALALAQKLFHPLSLAWAEFFCRLCSPKSS